jgi:hypothetical protein
MMQDSAGERYLRKVAAVKRPIHAVDVERLKDALDLESDTRGDLLKQCAKFTAIYATGRKPSARDESKLRRTVDSWLKTTRMVASVIGEQIAELDENDGA